MPACVEGKVYKRCHRETTAFGRERMRRDLRTDPVSCAVMRTPRFPKKKRKHLSGVQKFKFENKFPRETRDSNKIKMLQTQIH